MKNPLLITESDYPSYYQTYVHKVQDAYDDNPWPAFNVQAEELPDLLAELSEEQQLFRYAEGKWSVKEVVGHMTDTEHVFGSRALHFARAEQQPLIGFDENAYVKAAKFDHQPWPVLLEAFKKTRLANQAVFASFSDDVWDNTGVANGATFKLAAIPYIMVGHVLHHMRILRERYKI